jgi:hypothetical protein
MCWNRDGRIAASRIACDTVDVRPAFEQQHSPRSWLQACATAHDQPGHLIHSQLPRPAVAFQQADLREPHQGNLAIFSHRRAGNALPRPITRSERPRPVTPCGARAYRSGGYLRGRAKTLVALRDGPRQPPSSAGRVHGCRLSTCHGRCHAVPRRSTLSAAEADVSAETDCERFHEPLPRKPARRTGWRCHHHLNSGPVRARHQTRVSVTQRSACRATSSRLINGFSSPHYRWPILYISSTIPALAKAVP